MLSFKIPVLRYHVVPNIVFTFKKLILKVSDYCQSSAGPSWAGNTVKLVSHSLRPGLGGRSVRCPARPSCLVLQRDNRQWALPDLSGLCFDYSCRFSVQFQLNSLEKPARITENWQELTAHLWALEASCFHLCSFHLERMTSVPIVPLQQRKRWRRWIVPMPLCGFSFTAKRAKTNRRTWTRRLHRPVGGVSRHAGSSRRRRHRSGLPRPAAPQAPTETPKTQREKRRERLSSRVSPVRAEKTNLTPGLDQDELIKYSSN